MAASGVYEREGRAPAVGSTHEVPMKSRQTDLPTRVDSGEE